MRQQIAHAADQFVQFERFAQVLIGPHIKPAFPIVGESPCAENQHRFIPATPPQGLANDVPVHAGQHQIEDQQVHVLGFVLNGGQRRRAVPKFVTR